MKRSYFLKQLIILPFGPFFGKVSIKQESDSHFLVNKFYVAGFQYYDGPSMIRQIAAGEKLDLTAYCNNSYDKFAVAIHWKGIMLGYVPRSDNKHISRFLKRGIKLNCKVLTSNPEQETWKMLKVEVSL